MTNAVAMRGAIAFGPEIQLARRPGSFRAGGAMGASELPIQLALLNCVDSFQNLTHGHALVLVASVNDVRKSKCK